MPADQIIYCALDGRADNRSENHPGGHPGDGRPDAPSDAPADGFGLVRFSGDDAGDFLNAQLCNDVTTLSPTLSGIGGYCNPKGRLLMVARLFVAGDDYYLRLPHAILADTVKRLRMFVLRARVRITMCGEEAAGSNDDGLRTLLPGYGVIASGLPLDAPFDVPVDTLQGDNECIRDGDRIVIRVPGITPRYEIYGSAEANAAMGDVLSANGSQAHFGLWRMHDILAGLPSVYPETGGLFVPQMMNLDLIGGLSYTKGCYPGQEVVARTHYIGKIKRRMIRYVSTEPAAPGDDVFVSDFSAEQASGTVVDATPMGAGMHTGLAVVRLAGLDTGTIRLKRADGAVAEQAPLPYSLEAETGGAEGADGRTITGGANGTDKKDGAGDTGDTGDTGKANEALKP